MQADRDNALAVSVYLLAEQLKKLWLDVRIFEISGIDRLWNREELFEFWKCSGHIMDTSRS